MPNISEYDDGLELGHTEMFSIRLLPRLNISGKGELAPLNAQFKAASSWNILSPIIQTLHSLSSLKFSQLNGTLSHGNGMIRDINTKFKCK